ncbi:hypothetical protein [Chroococcidiopsis sp. CCMEE 29]|uniref:hypothetical protein n=1 Tax=Chroococcidiopsis sp. CCMEE 29 TaxID=155894 RepID=UPI00202270BF|nr:hypothetical protein [Chroococcidiopsis sp. CCMEE 29]
MSHASLIQTLPAHLRSSNGLATLASVGIHGLLLLSLPLLPLDSKETYSQRNIGLVSLTPSEQSRLPQGATEQVTLPPFATQPSELPPLPPPPPFQSGILPPLPPPPPIGNTSMYQYPGGNSLPQPPTLRVPSSPIQQYSQPPIPQFPVSQLPNPPAPPQISQLPNPPAPTQTIRLRQISPLPSYRIPPNQGLPSTSGLKPGEPFSLTEQNINPQNTNQSQNQVAIANQEKQPPTPSAIKLPERAKQELIARRNALAAQSAANRTAEVKPPATTPDSSSQDKLAAALRQQPQPNTKLPERAKQELIARRNALAAQSAANRTAEVKPPATTPDSSSQDKLAAALRQQPQPNTKLPERAKQELIARRNALAAQSAANRTAEVKPPAATPDSSSQDKLAAALRQQPQPNTTSSTSIATEQTIAQLETFKERQQRVQQETPNVVTKAPIREKIKTCEKQLDGRVAVFGVVVNPEGQIISGPDFMPKNSAGYVQQAAKNYVGSYPFPKTDSPTNQPFRLQFNYDTSSCSAPTSSTTENTPNPLSQS